MCTIWLIEDEKEEEEKEEEEKEKKMHAKEFVYYLHATMNLVSRVN